MATTDEELVAAALKGDSHAFEEIVKRYQRLVFNIIYHYLGRRNEVEDIAQEVFFKVYRSLSSYDPNRPLKAWLSRITVNSCLDELRKAKKQRLELFTDLTSDEEDRVGSFHDRFEKGEVLSEAEAEQLFDLLQRLMGRLNEKDRMVFVLREIEGLDYGEIASQMGSTELAVRIRFSRSRKKLMEALSSHL